MHAHNEAGFLSKISERHRLYAGRQIDSDAKGFTSGLRQEWRTARAGRPPSPPSWREYLADLDMFYLGTANAENQPYIQYRGGPPGFLKVLDEKTLGFADFGGNRQYVTLGNLSENPKAFLFLMDYAHQRRVKVWGTARVVEGDKALEDRLRDPEYPGKVERAILFTVEAWDVNCPQHIHQRFSERQIAPAMEKLQARIAELESEVQHLRSSSSPSTKANKERPHAVR